MKDIGRLALILMIFCALAAAALAGTYGFTSQVIEARQRAEQVALLQEFVPGATEFQESTEDGYVFNVGTKAGQLVGIAASFTEAGFKGGIQMMIGVDAHGKISGLKILGQSETPGLGARIIEPAFTGQYLSKLPTDPIAIGKDISAISGATISSKAVTAGVRKAVDKIGAKYLGAVAPVEQPIDLNAVADGTYRGTGQGLEGDIVVDVTVKSHKITDIKIVSENETPEIAGPALENLPKQMIAQQKVDVDVESGATWSSKGIIAAVKDALKPNAGQPAIVEPSNDLSALEDGTYRGTGQGLEGDIVVDVTVTGHKITGIKIVSQDETPEIAGPALENVPKRMIEQQKADVDVESGATRSSKGIIAAVKDALQKK